MWLYKRTKTGAIQSWEASATFEGYVVRFGQLGGKIQTVTTSISKGKQKRTTYEQAKFEVTALYKEKRDEGYKSVVELGIVDNALNVEEAKALLDKYLPIHDTDANGNLRPMLAKTVDWKKVKFPIGYEDKLDGVRSNISASVPTINGFPIPNSITVNSLSREGMSYDFGTTAIRTELARFFLKYPDVILDGELYLHGMPQNRISGAMRGGKHKPEIHDIMQYHVYDMIDTDMPYKARKEWLLNALGEFAFSLIIFHDYKLAMSKEDVDSYEEESIANGYEGGMLKPLDSVYEPGKRSWGNMKVKQWMDDEFEVTGYELGKRGVQDLIIVCKTTNGESFKATAMGSVLDKEHLKNDIAKSTATKLMGTVKFKFYSEYGIPNHSTFKGLREGKN